MKLKTKIGDKSLELIKKYAASRQVAYRLPKIDFSEVPDEVIIRECQKYADAVDGMITATVVNNGFSSDQRDALISFASDCGISALRQLSTLFVDEIPAAMLKYDKINGEVVESLTQRRREEYELFIGDEAPEEPNTPPEEEGNKSLDETLDGDEDETQKPNEGGDQGAET